MSIHTQSRNKKLLTSTKDNHIYTDDNRAHRCREELGNTTKHHDHSHGEVDNPAIRQSAVIRTIHYHRAAKSLASRHNIQDIGEVHLDGLFIAATYEQGSNP